MANSNKSTKSEVIRDVFNETVKTFVYANDDDDHLHSLVIRIINECKLSVIDAYNQKNYFIPPNLTKQVEETLMKIFESKNKEELHKIILKQLKEERDRLKKEELQFKRENLATEVEIKMENKSDLSKLIESMKNADSNEARESIKNDLTEILGLNTEPVDVLVDVSTGEVKTFDKFAVDKIRHNHQDKIYKSKDGKLILSETDLKRLQKENERPFQEYYVKRFAAQVAKSDERNTALTDFMADFPDKKKKEFDKYYERYIWHKRNGDIKSWEEFYEKVLSKKDERVRQRVHDKEADRRYSQKYRDKLKKSKRYQNKIAKLKARCKAQYDARMNEAIRLRNAMLREAQIAYRKHIRGISFTAGNTRITSDPSSILNNIRSDMESMFNDVDGKIATISTNQSVFDSEHIFKARVPTENEQWYHLTLNIPFSGIPKLEDMQEYKIVATLKPAIVRSDKATKTINGERKEIDFGCLFAATYFYTLVSNTPIDEEYELEEVRHYWPRHRIALKKRESHKLGDENKNLEDLYNEFKEEGFKPSKTYYRKRIHKPDTESVRGDWVMTFRGVNFKAFDSEPNPHSEKFSPDVYFNEEDFVNPITSSDATRIKDYAYHYYDDYEPEIDISQKSKIYSVNKKGQRRIRNTAFSPYIWNIAQKIYMATKYSESTEIAPVVHNINPRWQILEYGGYTSGSTGPWQGVGKYGVEHGITDDGFVYQAPMGFKRIVDAQYNLIMTEKSMSAAAYTNSRRSLKYNFDITKINTAKYAELRALFATQDNTLTIENIHNIDSNIVWRWEDAK